MRKYRFKQVDNYIKLFRKLNDGIYEELRRDNLAQASEYLQTAQQRAIDLGTFIEESEGLGHATVTVLEGFCEELYEINEEILSERGLSPDSAKLRLDSTVNKIENSANSDIKLERLVLFLPYKASMWDSLESVWKAENAKEDTTALVIPIPYYDKNPDGSFRAIHYEGNDYPKDVPVVSFEEFDFEREHPDEIYIHNPYDDLNYVTSVHPFFYSENLKKFTDKLIYIPYFVLAEPNPDSITEDELEHLRGFVLSRGVVNADEVIVQSEAMKKVYVMILTDHFGEESRHQWEEKIKGTGSPKFDKVKSMKREEQEIPEDWRRIMTKPDGTLKKVVFYNTSVTSILNQEQKMIDKIKDVLEVFKECQDDVALLWRPHPLIKATLDSMVPQIAAQYEEIVKEYRTAGWGIYDDTPDMDRAIVISDAYYGDGSSIVQLYETLEKPIMIQNVDVLNASED